MKPILTVLLGLAVLAPLDAQADQTKLKQRYEKKLSSAFLDQHAWHTDYDAARAAAKKSGKPIFGYFTRSYAP